MRPSPLVVLSALIGGAAAVYTYNETIDDVLTVFWEPRVSQGLLDLRLEAKGLRWIATGASLKGRDMLHAGVVLVGTHDGSGVRTMFLRDYVQSSFVTDDAVANLIPTAGIQYDAATDTSALWFTRRITSLKPGEDVDFSTKLGKPVGWIYAYGYDQVISLEKHEKSGYTQLVMAPAQCNRSTTCNGKGRCDALGQCVCDVGYGGSGCDICDSLYVPVSTNFVTRCVLYDSVLRQHGLSLSAALTVPRYPTDIDPSDFADAVSSHLVSAFGLDTVEVTATAKLGANNSLPSVTLSIAPYGAVGGFYNDVQKAVDTLVAQLGNVNSALFTSSITGQYLLDAQLTSVAPVLTSAGLQTYPFTASLQLLDGHTLNVSWAVADGGTYLMAEVRFALDTWFGLGFNSESYPYMVPGDAVACEPGAAPGQQVTHYLLNGYSLSECPATESTSATAPTLLVPGSSVLLRNPNGPGWICRWKRSLAGGGDIILPPDNGGGFIQPRSLLNGEVFVTAAHGLEGKRSLSAHTLQQTGFLRVDFIAGSARGETTYDPNRRSGSFALHALGGCLAGLIMLPFGALVARYKQRLGIGDAQSRLKGRASLWYRLHWINYLFVTLLYVAACVLAVVASAYADVNPTAFTGHFKSTHSQLGLATTALLIILSLTSVAGRYLKPSTDEFEGEAVENQYWWFKVTHSAGAWIVMILTIPLLYTGLVEVAPFSPPVPSSDNLFWPAFNANAYGWGLLLGVWVVVFLVMEVQTRRGGKPLCGDWCVCSCSVRVKSRLGKKAGAADGAATAGLAVSGKAGKDLASTPGNKASTRSVTSLSSQASSYNSGRPAMFSRDDADSMDGMDDDEDLGGNDDGARASAGGVSRGGQKPAAAAPAAGAVGRNAPLPTYSVNVNEDDDEDEDGDEYEGPATPQSIVRAQQQQQQQQQQGTPGRNSGVGYVSSGNNLQQQQQQQQQPPAAAVAVVAPPKPARQASFWALPPVRLGGGKRAQAAPPPVVAAAPAVVQPQPAAGVPPLAVRAEPVAASMMMYRSPAAAAAPAAASIMAAPASPIRASATAAVSVDEYRAPPSNYTYGGGGGSVTSAELGPAPVVSVPAPVGFVPSATRRKPAADANAASSLGSWLGWGSAPKAV